jgi:DNA repair ATPase RecN
MMNTGLQSIGRSIDKATAHRDIILGQVRRCKRTISKRKEYGKALEDSGVILQEIAVQTQRELEFRISHLVTCALEAVFDDPYEFRVHFDIKRGQTSVSFGFFRDGFEVDPMNGAGVGAVDVASFALRLSVLGLIGGKVDRVLILDEPFKHLSVDLQDRAGEILRDLSHEMGVQVIMITHEDRIADYADRTFQVVRSHGVSQCQMM